MALSAVRQASVLFFSQQHTALPILKRPIFWVFSFAFLAYFAASLAIAITFFGAAPPADVPEYQAKYNTATVPPTSWGTDLNGNACAFGGCTASPTQMTLTRSPTL